MEGNQMKMREALDRIFSRFNVDGLGRHWIRLNEYDWQLIQSALSTPPRNCDMGTPAEQNKRYEHYCFTHRTMERCCQDCPLMDEPCCELGWAQMPYAAEEGGAK